jgi:hypothetical protein
VMQRLRDRVVLMEIAALERARRAGQQLRSRTEHVLRQELGQTPTEYLMIVGLMAAVVVLVFATWYWDEVKTAAKKWTTNVSETVMGKKIQ